MDRSLFSTLLAYYLCPAADRLGCRGGQQHRHHHLPSVYLSGKAKLHILVIILGVLGGIPAFGLTGVAAGPVILAIVLVVLGNTAWKRCRQKIVIMLEVIVSIVKQTLLQKAANWPPFEFSL